MDGRIGCFTLSIEGSVDSAAEFLGPGEAIAGWGRRILVVAVGAGDDDLEAVAPLTLVGSLVLNYGCSPEGALEVGGRWWVGAVLRNC